MFVRGTQRHPDLPPRRLDANAAHNVNSPRSFAVRCNTRLTMFARTGAAPVLPFSPTGRCISPCAGKASGKSETAVPRNTGTSYRLSERQELGNSLGNSRRKPHTRPAIFRPAIFRPAISYVCDTPHAPADRNANMPGKRDQVPEPISPPLETCCVTWAQHSGFNMDRNCIESVKALNFRHRPPSKQPICQRSGPGAAPRDNRTCDERALLAGSDFSTRSLQARPHQH
jgi:hypothetical protein